jgi:hypothetical protein
MDADSNPASGMNCLQQSQFENRSLSGCRRQCDKTLNKVSNLGHGFIQTKVSNKNHQPFQAKAQPTNHARQQAWLLQKYL